MSYRIFSIVLLSIGLAACGGSTPPPVNEASPANETPPASDVPPTPPVATSEPCPLFCGRVDAACTRPQVADVSDAACGVMASLARAPREACPDHCCRPTQGTGPDSDADGLVDADDRCPNEPEDAEGFEDQDGCPDSDNDRDGIPDVQDTCCFAAEDADGVQDLDGCPDA